MDKPQEFKYRHKETNTDADGNRRSWGIEDSSSMARWEGEHLACSPCGKVAGGEAVFNGWPGPEVLLSLLPEYKMDYTRSGVLAALRAWALASSSRRRVCKAR
jgi:hypothetical protein